MSSYIPTLIIGGSLCVSIYKRYRTSYPHRGSRTAGYWACCLFLVVCSVSRIFLSAKTQAMDLFEFFNVPPTEKGLLFVEKQVHAVFPNEPVFTKGLDQLLALNITQIEQFWPALDVSMLRCPYLDSSSSILMMAAPPLLLKATSYLAQVWYIGTICSAAKSLKWQLSGMALLAIAFESSLLFLGPTTYRYRHNLLFVSDLMLTCAICVYLNIEMVYLQPNRLDPARVLRVARTKLERINHLNIASKEISEEVAASPELAMLFTSDLRSLGRKPVPQTEFTSPMRLVQQSENPASYSLQYKG